MEDGLRQAEMDELGNMKLLPNHFLEDKWVTQIHNLNASQLIAFVWNDSNFYLVDKDSGKLTEITNPSRNNFYHSIARVEKYLVIRDNYSVLLFNCVSLQVDHIVRVDYGLFGVNPNLMMAEREN